MRSWPILRGWWRSLARTDRVRVALGTLWILDGILQLSPTHFTAAFFGTMLRMNVAEPPNWLWNLETVFEPFVTSHAVLANACFVSLEVAIGVGLIYRCTARFALAVSIPWALSVWLFGEAAGGLFSPGDSALIGAPGAALLYAVVAVVVWPKRDTPSRAEPSVEASPESSVGLSPSPRETLADLSWVALWLGTAALESDGLNRLPITVKSEIVSGASSQPSALAMLDHAVGGLVGVHGMYFAVVAGLVQAAIGLGILSRRTRQYALVAGIVTGCFYGIIGQNLGGIFSHGALGMVTSGATDPGTGPILALLGVAIWRSRESPTSSRRSYSPVGLQAPVPSLHHPSSSARAPSTFSREAVEESRGPQRSRRILSAEAEQNCATGLQSAPRWRSRKRTQSPIAIATTHRRTPVWF